MPPKQVDISALEPRQLQSIHEQIQSEMENLAQSSVALQRAAGEYGNSGRALEQLSEQKEGRFLQACNQTPVYSEWSLSRKVLAIVPTRRLSESDLQISQCFCLSPQQCMLLASWQAMTPSYWI